MFIHLPTPDIPSIKDKTSQSGKRVYITPDGNEYRSITTMLGMKEKPWLNDWKKAMGAANATRETKRCSDRGTAIHTLAEKYLNNEPYPDFTKQHPTLIVSQFKRLRMFLNKINNIRAQEVALYSDVLQLGGRVDCIAEYDGTLSVIDFKTSTNPKTREMVQDYFLQCTAYAIMWHERTGEAIEHIQILMSVENGLPLIFKDKIDKYVRPLLQRIG